MSVEVSFVLTQVHREEDGSVVHNSNYTQLFDVHPLTSVNLVTDLRLVQGKTYQVVIIAVDESGGCVETSDSVTVDTTPPLGSQIGVGPESDMVSRLFQLLPVHKFIPKFFLLDDE